MADSDPHFKEKLNSDLDDLLSEAVDRPGFAATEVLAVLLSATVRVSHAMKVSPDEVVVLFSEAVALVYDLELTATGGEVHPPPPGASVAEQEKFVGEALAGLLDHLEPQGIPRSALPRPLLILAARAAMDSGLGPPDLLDGLAEAINLATDGKADAQVHHLDEQTKH